MYKTIYFKPKNGIDLRSVIEITLSDTKKVLIFKGVHVYDPYIGTIYNYIKSNKNINFNLINIKSFDKRITFRRITLVSIDTTGITKIFTPFHYEPNVSNNLKFVEKINNKDPSIKQELSNIIAKCILDGYRPVI